MRTRIFNNFASMSDRFTEDFETLWRLPAEERAALIPHVCKIFATKNVGQHKQAMDEAVTEIGGEPADLLRSLGILLYIHRDWNPYKDTADDFLRDLAELRLVPQDKAEEAKSFLMDFLAAVQADNRRRMEKRVAASMLPCLKACDTLVDFRAVIRNPFGIGLDDKIDDYEPQCSGFVPVILVRIEVDAGDRKTFDFQCQDDDLDLLLDIVRSAKMDLEAAKLAFPDQ